MINPFGSFMPGWLPKGWKRGDRLNVINAGYRSGPVICLQNSEVRLIPTSEPEGLDIVEFHESQRNKVKEWLMWFCFTEDYFGIARDI